MSILYLNKIHILLEKNNFKNVVGYVNYSNDNNKPLLINLPKLNESIQSFEKAKYISFIVNKKT